MAFGDAQEIDPFDPVRTFYRRYWDPFTEVFCTNCGSGDPETDLSITSPWNCRASATSVSPWASSGPRAGSTRAWL